MTMILPLILLMGVYYAVIWPLTNTLHLDGESVRAATGMLAQVPGGFGAYNSFYGELEIVKHFDAFRAFLPFSATDMASIESFSQGFNFLGLNLLNSCLLYTSRGSPHLVWFMMRYLPYRRQRTALQISLK